MSANTIITSIVTGGTNSHTTVAEEANSIATDFVSQGVVGAITLNTGSGGTGSFCVNADSTPDMGVTVKAGQAYITATPSSQDSQVLRARASADYTSYTINANSSGVTKYDWIYLSVSATNANSPDTAADNVTSIYTSRSSSNTTDNGTPPTYGLLLAVVTVANGASSITNSNISDKRVNASIGAQGGSLIVTQEATGDNAIIQAAGQDANISLQLEPKGTGTVVLPSSSITASNIAFTTFGFVTNSGGTQSNWTNTSYASIGSAVTTTIRSSGMALLILSTDKMSNSTASQECRLGFAVSGATTIAANDTDNLMIENTSANLPQIGGSFVKIVTGLTPGSNTFNVQARVSGGGGFFSNVTIQVLPL